MRKINLALNLMGLYLHGLAWHAVRGFNSAVLIYDN